MSDRWNVCHLETGDLRLSFLPGVGGRLWDVNFQGRSLLFQNPDLTGSAIDETKLGDLPTRSHQFGFPLWGGEKTWIAPDTSWKNGAPFPVLDSGAYEVTSKDDRHIKMASAICPITHLTVTRQITLTSATGWTIEHRVSNQGPCARTTGIWSVLMLNTPAKVGVNMEDPTFHTVFGSANGFVAKLGNRLIVDCSKKQEFKIGLRNADGMTLLRCGKAGPWLTCSVERPKQKDHFAHEYPIEVFNSGDYSYCEAEWHSPMRDLAPKETLRFQQTFQVLNVDTALDAQPDFTCYKELLSCMS